MVSNAFKLIDGKQFMWKFSGEISYTCNNCNDYGEVSIDNFDINQIDSAERQMGSENIYEINYEFDCTKCDNVISLLFEASEYPVELLNFVINRSSGARTSGEPTIDYLREIYTAEDLLYLYDSISELIFALKEANYLLDELTPRQFEEVVAEVFRKKGFKVDITKRTRDGGKDIIAIQTDSLGLENKYFIECKRYSEKNKISVDIVRSLYGVHNTADGPNKSIIVTTSTFTTDARKFVKQEIPSSWHLDLVDRELLTSWLKEYK